MKCFKVLYLNLIQFVSPPIAYLKGLHSWYTPLSRFLLLYAVISEINFLSILMHMQCIKNRTEQANTLHIYRFKFDTVHASTFINLI